MTEPWRPPEHSVAELLDLAIEVIAEKGMEGCSFAALALWSLVTDDYITRLGYFEELGPAEIEAQYRRSSRESSVGQGPGDFPRDELPLSGIHMPDSKRARQDSNIETFGF